MTRHAIARAKERFGLDLTEADMAAIRADIAAGRALLLEKASGRRLARYAVTVRGVAMCVRPSDNGQIVTVMHLRATAEMADESYRRKRGTIERHKPEPRRQRGAPDMEAE
jgi:hypothetical protein